MMSILLCGYTLNSFYGSFFVPMILDAFNRHQLFAFLLVYSLLSFDLGKCFNCGGECVYEDLICGELGSIPAAGCVSGSCVVFHLSIAQVTLRLFVRYTRGESYNSDPEPDMEKTQIHIVIPTPNSSQRSTNTMQSHYRCQSMVMAMTEIIGSFL